MRWLRRLRSFARRKKHIQLAACWAHARRKFYEAQEQDPGIVNWLLRQIGHLYRIERELRESKTVPTLRAVTRAHQSRPVYQRLHRLFTRLKTGDVTCPAAGWVWPSTIR